jgi:aspartate-semialdehyde dehydrogenase
MKIAIIGITGLVGNKLLKLLELRKFPITEFYPVASENSYGKSIILNNKDYNIITIDKLLNYKVTLDIVFFTSTNDISKQWIPKFFKIASFIIDNSSYYRLDFTIPLIIPEINSYLITKNTPLIANPNCSTAQLLMVLYPLHIKYKIKRIILSTYQSVSGSGYKGIKQLTGERDGLIHLKKNIYSTNIDLNCIPICGELNSNGYSDEEIKLEKETKKILGDNINISATAVRVPVIGGHSESVNIEFYEDYDITNIIDILNKTSGVEIKSMACPFSVKDMSNVWVDRIRRDFSNKNSLNLWIVADNLMKGAALNAIQIAEYLYNNII